MGEARTTAKARWREKEGLIRSVKRIVNEVPLLCDPSTGIDPRALLDFAVTYTHVVDKDL